MIFSGERGWPLCITLFMNQVVTSFGNMSAVILILSSNYLDISDKCVAIKFESEL